MRKKRFLLMILAAALMALPALAQNFGKPHKPKYDQVQKQQVVTTTTAPSASFQSTSTMTGSGSSYSANPTLNGNGMAAMPAHSGPRRAPDTQQPDPNTGDDPEGGTEVGDQPLGDAVLPLLFMSLAFGMFVYFRRKQTLKS